MIILRPAIATDAPAIAKVHVEAWHHALDKIVPEAMQESVSLERYRAMWESLLGPHAGTHTTILAIEQDRVIGFATASTQTASIPGADAELHTLYVSPDYQRRNVGRRLFHHHLVLLLDAGCGSLAASVLCTPQARGFFRAAGGDLASSETLSQAGEPSPTLDLFIWRPLRPQLLESLI